PSTSSGTTATAPTYSDFTTSGSTVTTVSAGSTTSVESGQSITLTPTSLTVTEEPTTPVERALDLLVDGGSLPTTFTATADALVTGSGPAGTVTVESGQALPGVLPQADPPKVVATAVTNAPTYASPLDLTTSPLPATADSVA